jgi:hypothetical protein
MQMTRSSASSSLIATVFGLVIVAGCSSPVMPGASSEGGVISERTVSAKGGAQASPGVYDLTFHVRTPEGLQEVSSLTVSTVELVLKARVSDSAGALARRGTATFEYCSYTGLPTDDITQPDEAPKEACAQGLATWRPLDTVSVTAGRCSGLGTGYACLWFSRVTIPRDLGFRFRYSPQGSGIAAATSEPENFTWVAAP